MKDRNKNQNVSRLRRDHDAPIGHSFDLIDRRVIELWLGSQAGISLPHFGPSDELRGLPGQPKPGT